MPQITFNKSHNTVHVPKTDLLENSFFKSRPHMVALADPPEANCSYMDPLCIRQSLDVLDQKITFASKC